MTEETKHIRGGGNSSGGAQPALFRLWVFFCPEALATEKRRRKEAGAPPTVGARGREQQRKTLEAKVEQVLDSTGEQCTVEQSTLAPVPATSAWEGPVGPQGTQLSHYGAHTSESGSEGT